VTDDSREHIFHCTEGGAHKFWRVRVEGNTQEIRFGRIGTAGQSLSKPFASPEESRTATDALIARKVARGYVEVTEEQAAQAEPKPAARRRARSAPWRQLLLPLDEAFEAEESRTMTAPTGVRVAPGALALEL
jgi:predicted DNA-binding WGR domain protein